MSEKRIYVEGGGDSKTLHSQCREGFRKLLERSGLQGRVPRIVACGSRNRAFDDFKTAHRQRKNDAVFLIVDSESPVADVEMPWEHLRKRDNWDRPDGAQEEQVFLMTTCMETWIVADREGMKRRCQNLQESALPAVYDLEKKERDKIQESLAHATRNCKNAYAKGKRSFEALADVNPDTLEMHLPSFARMRRILKTRL